MSTIDCLRASLLLQKRACGLDESEQLRLEEHLSGCERCDRESLALLALRDLALQAESPLDERARERAILRAMEAGREEMPAARARRPMLVPAAAAGLALAAAVTGLFFLPPQAGPRAGAPTATAGCARPGPCLLSGAVAAGGRVIQAGGAVESGVVLESRGGAEIDLGVVRLKVAKDTRIKWMKERSSVDLLDGALQAEVEKGNPFQVVTDHFLVVVAGTRFEVDRGQVRVQEGRVRVLSRGGDTVLAALGPGQSWRREPEAVAVNETGRPETVSSTDERRPSRASGSELLVRARKQLSLGRTEAARRDLEAALGRKLSRRGRAEAETLLAECALVGGDRVTAARRYLQVASRYPGLPAAENALFAAARLRTENGNRVSAHQLLERYIQQYPNGRFRSEVVRRLQALEKE